jgi:hypothetical protein
MSPRVAWGDNPLKGISPTTKEGVQVHLDISVAPLTFIPEHVIDVLEGEKIGRA